MGRLYQPRWGLITTFPLGTLKFLSRNMSAGGANLLLPVPALRRDDALQRVLDPHGRDRESGELRPAGYLPATTFCRDSRRLFILGSFSAASRVSMNVFCAAAFFWLASPVKSDASSSVALLRPVAIPSLESSVS